MKNKMLKLFVLAIAMFISVEMVSAKEYETYLKIGKGASLTSKPRKFQSGTHKIWMFIDYDGITFNISAGLYTKIETTYMQDFSDSCRLVGIRVSPKVTNSITWEHIWGQQPAGNYIYSFTNKIDGVSYPGTYVKGITMSPAA